MINFKLFKYKTFKVRIRAPETPFAKCDSLIAACLKKDPEDRVQNACLLGEHRDICQLICQLEAGILPRQLVFDQPYEACLKLATKKLRTEREISEIKTRADLELQRVYRKKDQDGLKMKGIGFYFGDDAESSRRPFRNRAELMNIASAIEKGMKHFNLKVCLCYDLIWSTVFIFQFHMYDDINFECGNWTFKSPGSQTLENGEDTPWKLSIKNTSKKSKFSLMKPKSFQIDDLNISRLARTLVRLLEKSAPDLKSSRAELLMEKKSSKLNISDQLAISGGMCF